MAPLRRLSSLRSFRALAPAARDDHKRAMDRLTAFGLFAVTVMLICYMLEERAPRWTLLFALGCVMGSVYGFLQGAWPFGLVELAWAAVAPRKWRDRRRRDMMAG